MAMPSCQRLRQFISFHLVLFILHALSSFLSLFISTILQFISGRSLFFFYLLILFLSSLSKIFYFFVLICHSLYPLSSILCFVCCYLVFRDKVSLYSPGWPMTPMPYFLFGSFWKYLINFFFVWGIKLRAFAPNYIHSPLQIFKFWDKIFKFWVSLSH